MREKVSVNQSASQLASLSGLRLAASENEEVRGMHMHVFAYLSNAARGTSNNCWVHQGQ